MRSLILAVGLLGVPALAFAAGPRVEIVISDKANPLERRAAEEVANALKRLYRAETQSVGAASGSSPAIFVGNPDSNSQMRAFAKDWPKLSEQGHVVRSAKLGNQPALLLGGGSPVATYWAASELCHHLGIRSMLYGDLDPVALPPFSLGDYEIIQKPLFKTRGWQMSLDSLVGPATWGSEELRRFVAQLAKMKYNRLLISVPTWQPFAHWEAEGVKKQTGLFSYGKQFSVSGDTAGRAAFRGAKFFENPDFTGKTTYEERLSAARILLQGLLNEAHSQGMTIGLVLNPLTFPKEFSEKVPAAKPVSEAENLAVQPAPEQIPNDAILRLAKAQIRAYLDAYPQLDAVYLQAESKPALEFIKRLQADQALLQRTAGGAVTAYVAGNSELASMPLGSDSLVSLATTASGILEHDSLPTDKSPQSRSRRLLLPLTDTSAGVLPQATHTAPAELLSLLHKQAGDGFVVQSECIGDLDLSAYLLSRNSFGARLTPQDACEQLVTAVCGEEVAARVFKALDLVERATKLIDEHEAGFANPKPDMILRHYQSADPPPAWWGKAREAYLHAMNEMYRANSRAREGGRSFTLYLARRYEFGFEYLNCVEAVRKAGLAKQKRDVATQGAELQKAVESMNSALNALAAVARSQSDRATIAVLNEYGYPAARQRVGSGGRAELINSIAEWRLTRQTMTSMEPLVYLRGKLIRASQASLKIYDAGVVLGATVTEMTRTFHHAPFRLADHLARLYRSLKYTRMDIGLSPQELERISHELISHNARLIRPDEELGLIHFVTAGEFPVYAGSAAGNAAMQPTVCAHTFPLPFTLWSRKMREGAHVVTPAIRHVPPQCFDPKMKYRSRMHYFLADHEARLVDPDAVALLLDLDGNVTETGGANFLIVEQGAIISPTLRNILPGISRQTVIELAAQLGITFVERDLQVHSVINADEAFLSSTPFCLLPVTKINGLNIGSGQPGPMFKRLMTAWSELVGLDIEGQFTEL